MSPEEARVVTQTLNRFASVNQALESCAALNAVCASHRFMVIPGPGGGGWGVTLSCCEPKTPPTPVGAGA